MVESYKEYKSAVEDFKKNNEFTDAAMKYVDNELARIDKDIAFYERAIKEPIDPNDVMFTEDAPRYSID